MQPSAVQTTQLLPSPPTGRAALTERGTPQLLVLSVTQHPPRQRDVVQRGATGVSATITATVRPHKFKLIRYDNCLYLRCGKYLSTLKGIAVVGIFLYLPTYANKFINNKFPRRGNFLTMEVKMCYTTSYNII